MQIKKIFTTSLIGLVSFFGIALPNGTFATPTDSKGSKRLADSKGSGMSSGKSFPNFSDTKGSPAPLPQPPPAPTDSKGWPDSKGWTDGSKGSGTTNAKGSPNFSDTKGSPAPLPQPMPIQPSSASIGTRIVNSASLNVRSQPWVGKNIIGRFNAGDRITVFEKDTSGYWCRVDYQKRNDAWVACPYLRREGTTTTFQSGLHGAATGNAVVNVSGLNVRSWAGMGNNIIGYLRQGEAVTLTGTTDQSGYWCKVNYGNNRTGWVACKYIYRK